MKEENFEYIKLYVRHPKNFGESGSKKEAQLITRSEQDDSYIEHAGLQGWEIKATSVLDKDDIYLEIVHMQRSSFHSNFSQKTFTDEYWKQMSEEKERRMKMLMYKEDDN